MSLPDDSIDASIDNVVSAILSDGGTPVAFAGDVSVDAQARACVAAALGEYRRLDVLINNAGVLLVAAETDKIPLGQFDEHIRRNIRTAFLLL